MTGQQPPDGSQGRWSTGEPSQQWAGQPQPAFGGPTASSGPKIPTALTSVLTPLTVAGASAVLLVLTVLSYALSWKKATDSGADLFLNGFGIQKITSEGDTARSVAQLWFFVALIIVLLLLAAAVLAAVSIYQKVAALLLTLAGGLGTVYVLVSFVSDLGMNKKFLGIRVEDSDKYLDFGLRFGIFFALLVGLVTVAVGVLYFFSATGPVIPRSVPGAPAAEPAPLHGIGALLRPIIVVPAVGALLILLVISFLLGWRTASESVYGLTFSLKVNGLGVRTFESEYGGEVGSQSAVDFLPLLSFALIVLLVVIGALLVALTTFRKVGGILVTVGAVVALLHSAIGFFTDMNAFDSEGDMGWNESTDAGTDPSVGVFLAVLLSLLLLAVAVLYVLKEFGALNGANQAASPSNPWGGVGQPQQFGQYAQPGQPQQYGQPGQPGRWS